MTLNKASFSAAFAKSSKGLEASEEEDPRVQELWALLEPSLEDKTLFQAEIRAVYIESTTDMRSWRRHRLFAVCFAVFIVLSTLVALGLVVFAPSLTSSLKGASDAVHIAFYAGCFGIVVALTALILRGAFMPQRKDEGSTLIPEQLKPVLEVVTAMMGHKG